MPVPVPRQRAIPAVESGQAPAVPQDEPSKEAAPRKEATVDNNTATQLSLLVIEDDPGGSTVVPDPAGASESRSRPG